MKDGLSQNFDNSTLGHHKLKMESLNEPIRFRVEAVSVGKVKSEVIKGGKISTAIVREASDQPITCDNELGIIGNTSAAHDAQVYAIFTRTYDFWSTELGVPRDSWSWCHWGENLTLQAPPNFDDGSVYLGDLWKFGDVVLEVVGSRIPCNKLAWRCGQPDSWLKTLAISGRCGAYLRVVNPGKIAAGGIGEVIRHQKGSSPISLISQMAYAEDCLAVRDSIRSLIREHSLIRMNRLFLERRLNMFLAQEAKKKRGWVGWKKLSISRIHEETPGVKSFYLKAFDGKPLPKYIAGQYLTVRLPSGLVRCWSLSDWSGEEEVGYYRITVKEQGLGSKELHGLKTTTVLKAQCPKGNFHLNVDTLLAWRQVYISAGIGITPMASMIKGHSMHDSLANTPALWIHVTQDVESFALRREFEKVNRKIPRHLFTTKSPVKTNLPAGIKCHSGRPDLAFFEQLLSEEYSVNPMGIKPLNVAGSFSNFLVCGPELFINDVRGYLRDCKVPENFISYEAFTADMTVDADSNLPDIEEANICFTRSGKCVKWSKEEALSILEAAENVGLELESGCRQGSCGSCEVKMLEGEVNQGLQEDGKIVRICVAMPTSTQVQIDA